MKREGSGEEREHVDDLEGALRNQKCCLDCVQNILLCKGDIKLAGGDRRGNTCGEKGVGEVKATPRAEDSGRWMDIIEMRRENSINTFQAK